MISLETIGLILLTLIGGLVYRYKGADKNTNPLGTDSGFLKKGAWALYSSICAAIISGSWVFGFIFFLPAFGSTVVIGHSAAQGMGRVPMATNAAKKKHEWFLADLIKWFPVLEKPLSWELAPGQTFSWKGFLICCFEFVTIGLIRGAFLALSVCAILLGLGLFFNVGVSLGALAHVFLPLSLLTALALPIAYSLGYLIPVDFGPFLRRGDTAWCEYLAGCGWILAYSLALPKL